MNTPLLPRLKVIGVGNEWRGDDAVGLLVVRRLKADQLPQVEITECRGTVTAVREAWKDAAGVIVVDAVVSGGSPGSIYRFNAHGGGAPIQLSRSPSTHGLGVAEALALGQLFQDLPPCLIIFGIEGKNFGPGQEVSEEVEAAIPDLVKLLRHPTPVIRRTGQEIFTVLLQQWFVAYDEAIAHSNAMSFSVDNAGHSDPQVALAALADSDSAGFFFFIADNQNIRNFFKLGFADFFSDGLIGGI